jgi:16S rRNA (guanine1207-N2)-methyltransferase
VSRQARDRSLSGAVAAEALSTIHGAVPDGSAALVASHHEDLERDLADLGANVSVWDRYAFEGRTATPWPAMGPYALAVVRLPKGKQAFRTLIQALAHRLLPDGTLWVHGGNDEGIKSAGKVLSERFRDVESVLGKRHCRVWRARGLTEVPPAPSPEPYRYEVGGQVLEGVSWPGLFAHGHLDPATQALLERLPTFDGRVLDFGCGAGVIGQFIHQRDGLPVDMSDVDALAVDTARRNVPAANVILQEGVPPDTGRYRAIVSNPPLHRGKDMEPGPLRALIDQAPRRLGRSGELWITTQGAVPLRERLQERFPKVELVHKDRRFTVWRAVR